MTGLTSWLASICSGEDVLPAVRRRTGANAA
jgi:hypothetical protein